MFNNNLTEFVRLYLQRNLYRDYIAAGSRRIGINNLKNEVLSTLPFPLPPLVAQYQIVAKINHLMTHCDRLEAFFSEYNNDLDQFLNIVLNADLELTNIARAQSFARL